MKFKTTKKAIMNGYDNVISVSYGSLQRLLSCEREIAYTTRAEGWAADIYVFYNTAIVTGYAPFGNFKPSHELCLKYNDRAEEIRNNGYDTEAKDLRELIDSFIEEVTNN